MDVSTPKTWDLPFFMTLKSFFPDTIKKCNSLTVSVINNPSVFLKTAQDKSLQNVHSYLVMKLDESILFTKTQTQLHSEQRFV